MTRMGKVTGFLEIDRRDRKYAPASERVRHYREFMIPLGEEATRDQAARCMDCGIPFCHNGCPVNNQIPDWNDLVYRDDWHEALRNLHSTNNFPEFTGRICPAPCEAACTLNIDDDAGHHQDDRMRDRRPRLGGGLGRAASRRRRRPASASPSSAPARPALPARSSSRAPATRCTCSRRTTASAACCATASPTSRWRSIHIDRRVEQMEAEGVTFHSGVHVGVDDLGREARCDDFDAVRAGRRRREAARPADPGPRARRHPLRHGVPAAAEPARRRRERRRRRPDPRHRQARRRDRRRRHRLRLRRHLDPPGRAVGDPARDHAAAARAGEQAADLAGLAAQAAHLVVAGGRRRARLRRA